MNRYCVPTRLTLTLAMTLAITLALLLTVVSDLGHAEAADPSADPASDNPPAGSVLAADADTPPAQATEALPDVRPDAPMGKSRNQLIDEPTNGGIDESTDGSIASPADGAGVQPVDAPPVVGELEVMRVEIARVLAERGGQRMVTVGEDSPASLASLATAAEELVFTVYFINPQTEPAAGLALVHAVPEGFEYVAFSGTGPGAEFTVSTDGGLSFHQEAEPDDEAGRASHLRWRFDTVLYPNTRGLVTFRARARQRASDELEPALPVPPAQAAGQEETSSPDEPAAISPAISPASNADPVRTHDQPADDADSDALTDAAASDNPGQ